MLADGSERTLDDGDELRAARVSPRRARRDRGGDAALRARLPAAQHRPAGAARGRARHACRSAPTRTTTSSSGPSRTRTSRSRARTTRTEDPPRRPGRARAYDERHPAGQPRLPRGQRGRAPLPAHDPAPEPLRLRGRLPARARRLVATRIFASERLVRFEEMEYALPREHAVDGRPRRARRARAPRGLVPDRAALQRRRRRAALARARARQRVRGRARLPRDGLRAGVPRGRGRAVGARRAPALGQALVPHRRRARARATRAGTPSRPRATSSTRTAASPTRGCETCWDDAHEDVQHLRAERSSTTGGPGGLPRRHGSLRAEDRRRRGSARRSTSCRPARRCARTTTSPTRSGCSCSGAS